MASRREVMRSIFGDDSEDEENAEGEAGTSVPSEGNTQKTTTDLERGMTFNSLNDLFNDYQEHARLKGFSVVKRTTVKVNGESDYKYALIVCDKARNLKANKTSKKVGCKARLNAETLENGSWFITKMTNEHNHEIDPIYSPLMPAHRQLSIHLKRQFEVNDIAGIRTCKNIRLCEVQSNGPENLGCLPKDCRNFIDARRTLRLGVGDVEAIHVMFARLQSRDPNFFHLMDIDDEDRLHNVLWTHLRSNTTYEEFHDVVSFDTTYLVNRYKFRS